MAGTFEPRGPATFEAGDTLAVELPESDEARAVLERLIWEPTNFTVRVDPDAGTGGGYTVVSFPSPPVADAVEGERVRLRWYAARNGAGEVIEAPAAVIVHSLHPQMVVANAIARGMAFHGIHAFVTEMPGFGGRGVPGVSPALVALERGPRTIAEVRRARDAVAALPAVADGPVALQGTSLGGFTAAVAGAIDDGFDPVFLALAGADGYAVLRDGRADAARLRQRALSAGYTDEQLRETLGMVDPRHVAHRLDPQRTWLFSAAADQVVPRRNSDLLASIIGLGEDHHVRLAGDHYTVVFVLPEFINRMTRAIKGEPET